jgi:glycosyltransferase involved in cell wall biosynthesis
MPNVYAGEVVRAGKVPLITAPRGTLSEWAMRQSARVKSVFWPLVQRPSVHATTCFHATSEAEYQDIRRHGFRQPVAVIPNGIDLPSLLSVEKLDQRTLLFLSRIHPVKGLDLLLPAWQAIQDRFPDWHLRIVGSDDGYHGSSGYLKTVQSLAADLQLKRVSFVGELTGLSKLQEYQNADLLVLPTYSENFGVVVAEALAAGTPAIVSKGAPWSGLNAHKAGWWVEIGLDPLVGALEQALQLSQNELAMMGQHGRQWMEKEYSWSKIAKQMITVYDWVTGKTSIVPSCVYEN